MIRKIIQLLAFLIFVSCNTSTNKQRPEDTTTSSSSASPSSPSSSASANKSASDFDTYCNARYEYCIDYPTTFKPQPESENGDGRVFRNKEGKEVLVVYGTMNLSTQGKNLSLKEQFNSDLQKTRTEKGIITYKKYGGTYYVISGYKNDRIFYQKTIVKENTFASAILHYNKAEEDTYSKIAERVFKSFKVSK